MEKEFIECGRIVNTFGVRGELKAQPWSDRPDFLKQFKTIYVGGVAMHLVSARVHQQNILLTLEGIDNVDKALPLKNKVIEVRRDEVRLAPGKHFVADLIGLEAREDENGTVIGTVTDVLSYPAQDLYEVKGDKTYLIPDVPAFVKEIHVEEGYILFHVLEGLAQ
ncbi:MAG: 16S rRNA processing protein RimM [Oscillospiraceae bacterium]|nr:16S rRNA processing protein RimM [Oscillospiraceae bacterium]